MKLLYIAYSCDPFNGSEDQIGWNIPISSEKLGNEVYVITKEEHRETITEYIENHPWIKINFFYVDIPKIYKFFFTSLLYSMRIILWQKQSYKLAKKICNDYEIKIIHQVTPIEVRALGDYGKIKDIHFVAGPIGGGFPIPKPLRDYTKKYVFTEFFRKVLNTFSFILLKFNSKVKKCDYIFFINEETKVMFDKFHIPINENTWEYHCDVGIANELLRKPKKIENKDNIIFLVPGRLTYRKGHQLLFDSIPRNIDSSISFTFRIVGGGPHEKKIRSKINEDPFLKKHVILVGKVPYNEMEKEYEECSVVVFPSLSEGTGMVLIEGIANSKPLITAKLFGAKIMLNEFSSWLYYGENKKQIIDSFRSSITEVLYKTDEIYLKSKAAYEIASYYTWDSKVVHFMDIYKKIMTK